MNGGVIGNLSYRFIGTVDAVHEEKTTGENKSGPSSRWSLRYRQ